MGAGVTFKPGGPSCPGGPRTPTPGDPCTAVEHMACPYLAGTGVPGTQGCPGHRGARDTVPPRVAPQGWGVLRSPGTKGHLPSLLWLQRTPWLPAKTPSHQEGLGSGAEDPPDSIGDPQHPSLSPPCASYLHLPQDPPAPRVLPAPPGRGKQVKSRVGRRCAGGAAAAGPSHPGQPAEEPRAPLGAALTFSPLGPGKPRSPLEPYQGESRVRGGGSHRTGSPPRRHGVAVGR